MTKEKKTRRRYTKEEKLTVLKEYSVSKKSKSAFEKINVDFNEISNDKKYFSKLINKWKKELYKSESTTEIFSILQSSPLKKEEGRSDFIMKDYIELKRQKEQEKEKKEKESVKKY